MPVWSWDWADTPPRRLIFDVDIPRQPGSLPIALQPHIDPAVTSAVAAFNDPFRPDRHDRAATHRTTYPPDRQLLDLELELDDLVR